MIRSEKSRLLNPYSVMDLLVVMLFAYCSPRLTIWLSPWLGWPIGSPVTIMAWNPVLAGIAIAFVPIVLHVVGFYHRANLQRVLTALRQLIAFCTYYLAAIAFFQTLRTHPPFINHLILVNMVGVPIILFLRFLVVRLWKLHALHNPDSLRQVILAGSEEQMEHGWQRLPDFWKRSMNVVGRAIAGKTTPEEVQKWIADHAVSHLMVFGGLSAYMLNEEIIHLCELQGIDIYLCRSEHRSIEFRAEVNDIDGVRMIIMTSTPPYTWARLMKVAADKIIALLMLICSSPVWLVAAVGIKLSDPKGPVFFRQQRSGLYGKPFGMWKFRSMYTDAEERLAEIKAKYGNEMDGPLFKLTNDPRIFPFGHFLRKFSIDELPQVLNVLCGDMSIVGPRPLAVYETDSMPDIAHRRRMSVKPGLTCYWQVEDRSDAEDSYAKMIEKDLRYIDNWSLWGDIVIFLRTIPAVLLGRGAK